MRGVQAETSPTGDAGPSAALTLRLSLDLLRGRFSSALASLSNRADRERMLCSKCTQRRAQSRVIFSTMRHCPS